MFLIQQFDSQDSLVPVHFKEGMSQPTKVYASLSYCGQSTVRNQMVHKSQLVTLLAAELQENR